MPTFEGAIQTQTRIALGDDAMNPGMGSLAGAANREVALVHGTRQETVDANDNLAVGSNLSTTVAVNEKRTVGANRITGIGSNETFTVGGNATVTVTGTHNTLQIGPRNDVNVSNINRLNASPDSQQEPTDKIRIFGVEFEHKQEEDTVIDRKMEIVGYGVEINGFKDDITGLNVEVKAIDLAAVLLISVEPKVTEVELKALHTFLEAAEGKAAGGTVAVSPSANAVPHVPTAGGH